MQQEQQVQIKWPFAGLSETFGFGSQEPGSAREAQNVRGLDPRTGRLRGAQRSGLSKYLTSALKAAGTKVADLLSFFIDNRQITYTAIASGSETVTWDTTTPSEMSCANVKTDRQGNVYALDGNAAIVKYSSDGEKLWQLALPVKDTNHIVRALFVDEFDNIYAGVSEGGKQDEARLWCYQQLPDDKTEQLWEIVTKEYVEDIVVSDGKLYAAQNKTDRRRSYVRIYDFIDETDPSEVKSWQVPHPVNSIALKADSSVIVACEANGDTTNLYWREPDPLSPNFNVTSVDWTPDNLDEAARRIWSWFIADELDETDVAGEFEDGVEILRWRDRTKNLRHVFAPSLFGGTHVGPVLAQEALNGRKGVRFNGTSSASVFQFLQSDNNSSYAKEFADNQRTITPAYSNNAWALFMVWRLGQQFPSGGNTAKWLFGQDRDNATGSGGDDHILFQNVQDDTGDASGSLVTGDGYLYWYTGESVLSGGDGTPVGSIHDGRFDVKPDGTTTNPGQFVITCMVNDGNITGESSSSTQESLFQVNGNPIDKFQSRGGFTLYAGYFGVNRPQGVGFNPSSGCSPALGDLMEAFVLDRKSRVNANENVLTYDSLQFNSVATSQTVNEMTLITGYLAHAYGAQANLPFGTAATNNYPHPFGITGTGSDQLSGPPNQAGTGVSTAQALANKMFGCVVKYSAEGKIQWTANEMATGDGTNPGGFGYAVAINSDGNIYSLGPNPTRSGGVQQVRMIVDQGTTFSIAAGDGAWSAVFPANADQDYHFPRIDVDEFDNLYIPYNDTAAAASLRVYKKDGTLLHSKLLSLSQQATAVAVDRRIPDYRDDLTTKTVEHVIVATENGGTTTTETLHKVRLVSAAQASGPVRTLTTMGVSGGDIVKFTTSGVTTPTGGSGALDSTAKYVQSTTLYKKAYWTDGRQLKFYDPIEDEVATFKSLSSGSAPDRCALVESWRGRIVLARSADEPHNWFMSKKDEPTNWDYFPPVPSEIDAVAGNNSPAGLCPDIINSVVPYSEDVLVFGGDHSIWALVGDPAAGGRLELVSDTTGMSFGRPWTKDPNGVLYFFGSQGGVYKWIPGAKPERVSLFKIERQLQDVDLGTNYIRMVYNYRDEGIHIFQCPFGAGATLVDHWFLELKTGAFAKDVIGNSGHTNVQPTAAIAIDGDDFDDRLVLLGGEDGFVRKWDRAALSDDTQTDGTTPIAIDSLVTIGPLQGDFEEAEGDQMDFSGLTVILSAQDDGARYELYASEDPESIGTVLRSGALKAGRNPPRWDPIVGPYCWLRLRNTAPEERWAFERAYIRASPAGVVRPRSA